MKKSVYTAGPIDRISEKESTAWRAKILEELSPEYEVYIPSNNKYGVEIWGRDYYMLDHSDILIVNLNYPNDKPYLGTAIEISRAFYQRKPIIIFSNEEWVHNDVTLKYHANKIVNTLDEAIEYLQLNFY